MPIFLLLVFAGMVYSGVVPPFFGGIVLCCGIQAVLRSRAASSSKRAADSTASEPALITVVGNIGAGKSTALQAFQRDLEERPDNWNRTVCVSEPVEAWAPMLEAMAASELAWLELQVTIAGFYASLDVSKLDADVVISERDLMSVALFGGCNRAVAGLLLAVVDVGNLVLPDVVVFLSTPWEVCLERVQSSRRAQAGDDFAANQGAEYFRALHDRHTALVKWYAAQGCHVITIGDSNMAVIGITEARAQALDLRQLEPAASPRPVTKAMMAGLLHLLWPPLTPE